MKKLLITCTFVLGLALFAGASPAKADGFGLSVGNGNFRLSIGDRGRFGPRFGPRYGGPYRPWPRSGPRRFGPRRFGPPPFVRPVFVPRPIYIP